MEEKYEHYRLVVSPDQGLLRVDSYIVSKIKYATRNRVQQAIKNKNVLVNDKPVKAHYSIKPNDVITIFYDKPPKEKKLLAESLPLNIIYEDDHLMIVNKLAGMLTHPSLKVHEGTLVNGLLGHFDKLNSDQILKSPGLVHRLDKDTSGLIIVAKTDIALRSLSEQFSTHSLKRKYLAIVWGVPKSSGKIDAKIEANPLVKKVKVSELGKEAITHYKVLETNNKLSLIECELETGRTHQIRVHFEHLGYPLFNDPLYSSKIINEDWKKDLLALNMTGQALHSYYINFFHPVLQKHLEFKISKPESFDIIMSYKF